MPTRSPRRRSGGGGVINKGEKLKVLEKQGDFTKVRDQQGNDGWVPTDAL